MGINIALNKDSTDAQQTKQLSFQEQDLLERLQARQRADQENLSQNSQQYNNTKNKIQSLKNTIDSEVGKLKEKLDQDSQ